MFVVLGTMIISCSKKDNAAPDQPKELSRGQGKVKGTYAVLPPYNVGEPGTDPATKLIFPKQPEDIPYGPKYPFTLIDLPTAEYLKETCLFDISKLENKKTYHKLQNGSLTLGFFDFISHTPVRLLKLNTSSAKGWNSAWGTSPNVERENPNVLYAEVGNREDLVIYLSKPCTEFGFEIAPNHKNYDHLFDVSFGDWIYDNSKGGVSSKTAKSPGAKLVAIKATKPFTMITIGSADSPGSTIDLVGFAISNIRYTLAK